jgi:hypothetical protein
MIWLTLPMSTDLLHALCALASLAVPLGIAWVMLGRDARPKDKDQHRSPADTRIPKR